LAGGTTWSAIGSMVSQGCSLLMGIALARILMPNAFGWFTLIQATVLMLQSVGGLGLGLATTSHLARTKQQDRQRAGRIVCMSVLATSVAGILIVGIILVVPTVILQRCLGTNDYPNAIKLLGLLGMLAMINKIQTDILIGLEAFKQTAFIAMIRGAMAALLAAMGAYASGAVGAVAGLGAAWLLSGVISQAIILSTCRNQRICLAWGQFLREYRLLGTSMFVSASSLWLAVVNWLLNIILARQPNGLAELAIFNAADRWRTAMLFVPGLLAQVSLPMFASAYSQHEINTCKRLMTMAGSTAMASTGICVIAVFLTAHTLMAMYGNNFVSGDKVLLILALSCLPTAASMIGSYCLWAVGRTGTMLSIDLVRGLVSLSYCLFRRPICAMDLAMGILIGYIVSATIVAVAIWPVIRQGRYKGQQC